MAMYVISLSKVSVLMFIKCAMAFFLKARGVSMAQVLLTWIMSPDGMSYFLTTIRAAQCGTKRHDG